MKYWKNYFIALALSLIGFVIVILNPHKVFLLDLIIFSIFEIAFLGTLFLILMDLIDEVIEPNVQ